VKCTQTILAFSLTAFSSAAVAGLFSAPILPIKAVSQITSPPSFEADVLPLLDEYCAKCHEGEDAKGKIDLLKNLSEDEALLQPDLYFQAAWEIWRGTMPPASAKKRPSHEERTRMLRWVDETMAPQVAAFHPQRLRRLNNFEYRHVMRDLFGVEFDVEGFFPADTVSNGFDNIGSALSLSHEQFEKYVEAAETVVAMAVVSEEGNRSKIQEISASGFSGSQFRFRQNGISLFTNGLLTAQVKLPRRGTYRFRVFAWGEQAGRDPVLGGLQVNNHDLGSFSIPNERGDIGVFEKEAQVDGGVVEIGVSFLNDFYQPKHSDPKRRDRNLILQKVEIVGPLDFLPKTEFQEQIEAKFVVGRRHPNLFGAISYLAERIWRRPPGKSEVNRLFKLTKDGKSWEDSLSLVLKAMLFSPKFLFRLENQNEHGEATDQQADFSLASQLSFFLWGSVPDEELLALARSGNLRDVEVFRNQIGRLLKSPKARALADGFASQWLQTRNLINYRPAQALLPSSESMQQETLFFFDYILREEKDVRDFIQADYTFMNSRLATFYGIDMRRVGEGFQKVSYGSLPRRGVLSHASFLTLTSDATRTSPVKRGKWVMENLLDSPLPPPPPGADSLDDQENGQVEMTFRERLELHRSKKQCVSCHAVMDPLVLGLENYDFVVKCREEVDGIPVDSSGVLPDGREFHGPSQLISVIGKDPRFIRALVSKLATFAFGRPMEPRDRPMIQLILDSLNEEKPTLKQMITGILLYDAFGRISPDSEQ